MSDTKTDESLTPSTQGIEWHLGALQSIITRMAANSSSCKAWCITIMSAVVVVVADKGKPDLLWLAGIPVVAFWLLDCYYLGLERGFRGQYTKFVQELHAGKLKADSLYLIGPLDGSDISGTFKGLVSWSTTPVYGSLVALLVIAFRLLV